MADKIIIAIDGFSSCGKSTIAKGLARELKYIYIDSGAMYRAVTLYFLQNNIDWNDEAQVLKSLSDIKIHFRFNPAEGTSVTYLNGANIEEEIRSMRISKKVSYVSKIRTVRQELVRQQQEMGKDKGVVMDGRDIGTVVFPEAELKLYITADLEERAERRFNELKNKRVNITFDEVKDNLIQRDEADMNRLDSPLLKAADAIEIDTTDLSPDKQMKVALDLAKERIND